MPHVEFNQLLNWPNLISVSRIFLAGPTLYGLVNNLAVLTALSFTIIILSDLLDGVVARRIAKPNPYGTLIDHGSDAIVVVILSSYFSHTGLCSWLLPMFIVSAFLHYAFDSVTQRDRPSPRPSLLGRVNGISYFVFVAACIGSYHGRGYYSVGIADTVTMIIGLMSWLLIATTCLSIWQRTRL